jgi:MFS family permease
MSRTAHGVAIVALIALSLAFLAALLRGSCCSLQESDWSSSTCYDAVFNGTNSSDAGEVAAYLAKSEGYSAYAYGLVWSCIFLVFAIFLLFFDVQDQNAIHAAEGAPLLGDSTIFLLDTDGRESGDLETNCKFSHRNAAAQNSISMKLVYFASLSNSIDYAVKMPTINDYIISFGGSTFFLGCTIAACMAGRTVFFMILGPWADRRGLKEPFMFAQLITIVGELLYVSADSFCLGSWSSDGDHKCSIAPALGVPKEFALGAILAGRLLVGIGTADSTLCQVYISRVTSAEDRTGFMSKLALTWMVGLLLGPAFATLFRRVNIQLGMFRFHEDTLPGHIMIIINLVSMVLFQLYFKNPPEDDGPKKNGLHGQTCTKVWTLIRSQGGWYCMLVNFMVFFEMSGFETAVTPLTREWGWGSRQNSLFFVYIAAMGLLALASTSLFEKYLCFSNMSIIVSAFIITRSVVAY